MEQLTVAEFLCIQGAFIGNMSLDCLDPGLSQWEAEDAHASNGSPGFANFVTSMIEPLESQGRGFAHGRKKVNGVRSCRAARLQRIFETNDEELHAFLKRLRVAVLEAASTIQYDAADLPAAQLGVQVLPEPFSAKQRLQTRFDGEVEIDGETVRPDLPVTPVTPSMYAEGC